jgi:hypothetical protein
MPDQERELKPKVETEVPQPWAQDEAASPKEYVGREEWLTVRAACKRLGLDKVRAGASLDGSSGERRKRNASARKARRKEAARRRRRQRALARARARAAAERRAAAGISGEESGTGDQESGGSGQGPGVSGQDSGVLE